MILKPVECPNCGYEITIEEQPSEDFVSEDQQNFQYAVEHTLEQEGVFADDTGGPTLYGIASKFHPDAYKEVKELHDKGKTNEAISVAINFYYEMFWLPMHCNKIENRYVAAELFDTAVNVGIRQAAEIAQEACNDMLIDTEDELEVDGWMGPLSVSTLNSLSNRYLFQLLACLNLHQGLHYVRLINTNPSKYGKYFRGWMKRLTIRKEVYEEIGM